MMTTARRSEDEQFRARISGRVQGVGFRFFVEREAVRLGLRGWVRNLAGGEVEVVAQGPRERLDELLARLREGPPLSWVANVTVDQQPPDKALRGFQIKPTGW